MEHGGLPSFAAPVALFPLPNAVLLPGGTLPLYVFEDRYRAMVQDALAEDGVIAIALLRPGYEPVYETNSAEIFPVICAGKIREHLETPDGRYFINLLGLCRARVRREDRGGQYRLAMVDPMIEPTNVVDVDGEYGARRSLREVLASAPFDEAEDIERMRTVIDSDRPLGNVVDLVASGLLSPNAVEVRQHLLEEMQVIRRARTLIGELKLLAQVLEVRQKGSDEWPRLGSMN
jgi:Lon protease-like protein